MTPFMICVKRNLKSVLFIIILAIMPLIAVGYNIADKSLISKPVVGLYFDCNSEYIFDDLYSDVVDFRKYYNKDIMIGDINRGTIDCGYVFDEKFDSAVNSLDFKKSIDYIITSSSVIQPVANEFIFGEILKNISPIIADRFFEEKNINISSEEYYNKFLNSDEVFSIEFEKVNQNSQENDDFKLINIFAVFIMIGCIIRAISVVNDRKKGMCRYNYIYILSSATLIVISAVIGALICGEFNVFDMPLWIMYTLTVSFFAYIISFIGKTEIICGMLPVILILSFVLCPVIFDIGIINSYYSYLGYILPVTYFVKGNVIGLGIYTIVLGAVSYVLKRGRIL